jgi:hypothetical protein
MRKITETVSAHFGSRWADVVGSERIPCVEYRPPGGGTYYFDKEQVVELIAELQQSLADWAIAEGEPLRSDQV